MVGGKHGEAAFSPKRHAGFVPLTPFCTLRVGGCAFCIVASVYLGAHSEKHSAGSSALFRQEGALTAKKNVKAAAEFDLGGQADAIVVRIK